MASLRASDPHDVMIAINEAVKNPIALVQLLYSCSSAHSAAKALQCEYGWNEHQARAVMGLQFKRVTEEHRNLIQGQVAGDT